ncbi:Nramp family divalent metal transporter [Oceanobacillus bengalensis]|uniref:Divalent metal cation transporter n=1 Tax=Oceanobacillus bengalensis TaxID=1435466 RepID=A0A494YTD0_9BACI|nr:Nramp family divalent metal transporter [Oceanobacillus bengalensis]RKQ13371.1 divalent metal cation transporter [Oceanobacillus bengalensis]
MHKKGFLEKLKNVGPGAIVAAAIVGPGTIATASQTGAEFGYALIWAVVFSIIATMFLQEMSTRLGVVSRIDLGTAFRRQFTNPVLKTVIIVLIISAVTIGNAAYEAGNITGGAIGLATITNIPVNIWGIVVGLVSGLLLWFGNYKTIERIFVVLILIISLSFFLTAIVVRPDLSEMLTGFVPTIPDGTTLLVVSLIGTTIVPYTLFLQSSTVQERWKDKSGLGESRFDIIFSLLIVMVITVSIMVSAAVAFPYGTGISDPTEMAVQLEPLLGSWAKYVFSIGIFAAGVTSAMTAPLAAAYATTGVLGWSSDLKSRGFRFIWITILAIGIIFSAIGYSPIELILFSQYANGLILPVIVLLLMFVMNNKRLLGENTNPLWVNIAGWAIFAVTLLLSLNSFGIL